MSIDWDEFSARVPINTIVRTRDHGLLFEAMDITVGSITGMLLENYPQSLRDQHRDYARTNHLRVQPMRHTRGLVYESAICLHYWMNGQWLTFIQMMCLDTPATTEGEQHV